ncbi:hypothetical protein CMI48_01990 [Candidatus Pacearchaeota archaeon]|nr:hypothetical protein [Candidatus Pacearchaeota archaeon]
MRHAVGDTKMKLDEALKEIRKGKERKFDQSVDLLINLRGVDLKRDNVNVVVTLPHALGSKKVCGFLTKKSDLVTSVLEPDFQGYAKDPKKLKKLADEYDFFIAAAPLMPKVATTFGRVLGPAGKMPSPQLGILAPESDESIQKVLKEIGSSVKLRAKETSLKLSIGKLSMEDAAISENLRAIVKGVLGVLPSNRESVKNVLVKTTMGKPVAVEGW